MKPNMYFLRNCYIKINDMRVITILFIFIFFTLNNFIWLKIDKSIPYWDEARHMETALKFFDNIPTAIINPSKILIQTHAGYGPLFYLVTIPFIFYHRVSSPDVFSMVNILWTIILFLSVYKISRTIYDIKTGLLSVFIISMCPIVFGLSRKFLLDYALMSMVSLTIYLLIYTKNFTNIKYSLLFGLSFGLGMLIKINFIVFIIGPLLYILFLCARKERRFFLKKNLILSICITISLFFFGYYNKLHLIIEDLLWGKYHLMSISFGRAILFFIFVLVVYVGVKKPSRCIINKLHCSFKYFYLLLLVFLILFCLFNKDLAGNLGFFFLSLKDQLGSLLFTVFFCSLFFASPYRHFDKLLIIWWCSSLYIIIYFFIFRGSYTEGSNIRYLLPSLPPLVIVLTYSIFSIPSKTIRKIFIIVMVFFGFLQFYIFSYCPLQIIYYSTFMRFLFPAGHHRWLIHPASKENIRVLDILQFIKEDAKKKNITLGLFVDTNEINNETFSFYVYAHKLPIKIIRCVDGVKKEYFNLDYIITLENPMSWYWGKQDTREFNCIILLKLLKQNTEKYYLIKEFNIPNNIVYIYKKHIGIFQRV